ncbi:GAF and ANTAR domain-containing protein [Streptomyces sp. NPDC006627]|uniref:GAF and ANTAR domain-containing protein n=1 Tax=Streptomyces sp. NPDC006627 TaxID=3154679 RepID=UPI0033A70174
MTREERLLAAVIEAVDTLVDDFDLIDFLQALCARCTELLDVSAAGVMLEDPGGKLQLIAASDEHTRLLELFALQHEQGPCVECHRTGTARLNIDLCSTAQAAPFPVFAARAREAGFLVTHALPMRLRDQVIGGLSLFDSRVQDLSAGDARVAQSLADVATIAILQHRTIAHANQQRAQMHAALTSRVVIEQAKGILAERWNTSVDDAFDALRRYARAHQLGLSQLCRGLIDGQLAADAVPRP